MNAENITLTIQAGLLVLIMAAMVGNNAGTRAILRELRGIRRSSNVVADAIEEKEERRAAKKRRRASGKLSKLVGEVAQVIGEAMLADEAEATPDPVPAYRQPAPMHAPTQRFRTYPLNQGETAFVADLLTELVERPVAPEENGTSADYRKQARAMRDHMHATMRGWNPGCMAPDCEVCEPGHDGAK